jgi:acyl-CoA thioester hydrolase
VPVGGLVNTRGEFRFSTELKVRFETDAQGVAHHAAYLDWLEVARVEYLARFPGGYQARDEGIEATTLEAHVRYRAPARFDDVL